MKKIINITLSLFVTILLAGCAATVEGEQKSFDKAKAEIQGLSGHFNRYTPLIKAQVTDIDAKWAKAMETVGEDAKIEALEGVNNIVRLGSIKPLYELQRSLTKIESDIKFMRKRSAAEVQISTLKEVDLAEVKLKEIQNLVSGAPIENIDDAPIEINGYISQLNSAGKYVGIAVKQIKDKIAAEKKAKAKAKADARKKANSASSTNKGSSKSKSSSEPAKKMVKCKYCKGSYLEGTSKCKSCGAKI
tara:strand:- start:163 stop:903 length:741 start_codon:yes stop_codon:yes gene_type:complete